MSEFSFTPKMLSELESDITILNGELTSRGAGAQVYKDIVDDISTLGVVDSMDGDPVYGPVPKGDVSGPLLFPSWDWRHGAMAVDDDSGFVG